MRKVFTHRSVAGRSLISPEHRFASLFQIAGIVLLSTQPAFAQLTPVGSVFAVGTQHQYRGNPVAGTPDGTVVVVDPNILGIVLHAYDEFGTPFPTVQVNTDGGTDPSVAVASDGRFLVTWVGVSGVTAQLLAPDGSLIGSQVAIDPASAAPAPVGAFLSNGGFVVVWDDGSIRCRVFDSNGFAVTTSMTMPSYAGSHAMPDVVGLPTGGFVATWDSRSGQDGADWGIFAKRYDDAGSALGSDFQVNTYTPNRQGYPHLAAAPNGEFAIVWQSYNAAGGSEWDSFGQIFAPDGAAVGSEFRANVSTPGWQAGPDVAATDDAQFVVLWQDFINVVGRLIGAGGTPLADEIVITASPNSGDYLDPFLAKTGPFTFAAVWYQGQTVGRHLRVGPATTSTTLGATTTTSMTTTTTTLIPPTCGSEPQVDCLTALRGQFRIVNDEGDSGDRLDWKWNQGDTFDWDDLGVPGATSYRFCIYDSTAGAYSLVGSLGVEPTASWRYNATTAWTYLDSSGAVDGVRKLKLRTDVQGKSAVQLRARGAELNVPVPVSAGAYFDQSPTVKVQLTAFSESQDLTCWTNDFPAASTQQNNPGRFVAKQ